MCGVPEVVCGGGSFGQGHRDPLPGCRKVHEDCMRTLRDSLPRSHPIYLHHFSGGELVAGRVGNYFCNGVFGVSQSSTAARRRYWKVLYDVSP